MTWKVGKILCLKICDVERPVKQYSLEKDNIQHKIAEDGNGAETTTRKYKSWPNLHDDNESTPISVKINLAERREKTPQEATIVIKPHCQHSNENVINQ